MTLSRSIARMKEARLDVRSWLGRCWAMLSSTCGRGNGVSESIVFSMREHHLHGLRIPFDELTQDELALLNCLVKIIYRRHIEITSSVGTFALK